MDVEMLMAENGKIHIFYQSFGADWMTPDINMKLGLKERAHFFLYTYYQKDVQKWSKQRFLKSSL